MAGTETAVVTQAFSDRFGTPPTRVFRAPGRVNLIGEHTDYNLGFVMPIAMEMACFVATGPSSDGMLRVYTANMKEGAEWPVSAIASLEPRRHWTDYVIGVAQQLLRAGVSIEPMQMAIYSTVPVGSGLSSSASIEVSTLLALLQRRSFNPTEMALLAQRAEREFVGVPCGIMDQYVAVFGEAGKAIRIDCRSISHEASALPPELRIIAVNSMVKHDLGASAYPIRVQECADAVEAIRKAYPAVNSLRDVPSEMLDSVTDTMDAVVFRRARHVVTENDRVLRFSDASEAGDLHEMGRLFLASHRSMQHDYEITAPEIDFLVETAEVFTGVYGCRMTGGGFGGCTVNLLSPERADIFKEHVAAAYKRRWDIDPQIYDCVPAQGAGEVQT
ncbi:MAG TPA: galactokinase [Bryobacteraceae bacterium]|nr:galactokinase [Bryobacteraceae bacterium]